MRTQGWHDRCDYCGLPCRSGMVLCLVCQMKALALLRLRDGLIPAFRPEDV